MRASCFLVLLLPLLVLNIGHFGTCNGAGLAVNFYQQSCPSAGAIVRKITWAQGCDASILLDSPQSEKASPPNFSVARFEVIGTIKAELERVCPGKVSCADIIALATRDAVSFQFKRSLWKVETGRRDATVSMVGKVNLPNPEFSFLPLKQAFMDRGPSVADLVALLGGHTLGRTNCGFVTPRLFTFKGNNGVDPMLGALSLKKMCPNLSAGNSILMEAGSEFKFDSSYFTAIKNNRGVFLSDAALLHDNEAARIVSDLQDQNKFLAAFA